MANDSVGDSSARVDRWRVQIATVVVMALIMSWVTTMARNSKAAHAATTRLECVTLSIEQIKIDAGNARRHPAQNIDALVASLRRFKQQKPIVVRKDLTLIAGAGTVEAARRLGWTDITAIVSELDGQDAAAYAIADNRTTDLSHFDDLALVQQLELLIDTPCVEDMSIGFAHDEVLALIGKTRRETTKDPDAAPPLPRSAVSRAGDVWLMRSHRLVCGDCTDPAVVDLALAGCAARMAFTDPPYNMAYRSKHLGGIRNDDLDAQQFTRLVLASTNQLVRGLHRQGAFYICMGPQEYANVAMQLRRQGLEHTLIIWAKPSPGMGAQEYRPQYELMLFGQLGDRRRRVWNGGRTESNLWVLDPSSKVVAREEQGGTVLSIGDGFDTIEIRLDKKVKGTVSSPSGEQHAIWFHGRESGKYVHPTQKPVDLVEREVRNSSKTGDRVLDLFGGSGTTLIACERLDRAASLIELDPKYCDVILRRWLEFTGMSPKRQRDGATFDELSNGQA